jgi:hypothetical protein
VKAIRTALFVVAGLLSLRVPPACAQSSAPPGRVELAIGPLWIGRQALGSSDANETTSTGGALTLFSASTELASASGWEGRVGVKVWRSLEAEASATYATPEIRSQISSDLEATTPVTVTERIQQFTVGGGIVWYPPLGRSPSRLAPFVTAGGGYLRQLHEAATLVQTGQFYQLGGGVKFLFASRPGSRLRGFGARVDARAIVRSKGVAFDSSRHTSPALGASLFVRF